MADKIMYALIGWALAMTVITIFVGWLLYKKTTVDNNITIKRHVTKRNRDSNIKSDITPTIETNEPKKARKRILTKRRKRNET
jgi:hypothetical protein